MRVPELDKRLGIEVYASCSPGIGGRIRQLAEDFMVEEILVDGSKAEVSPVEVPELVGRDRHLICVMVKRDWDTLLAVKTLANRLRISRDRISLAGIKDAKALTAQHISISRIMPERVSEVRIKDITLRPFRFSDERVFSELIMGNEFQIIVRAISHEASMVEQRIKRVQSELSTLGGAPNFFGHQRFGTIRPVTHIVGRFLTQGDWEKAAFTFLAEQSPYEHPESREARRLLRDTRDFGMALRCFPENLRYERSMLKHLAGKPKGFVGSFRRLPKKLCRLFVQAYQSYIFNRFLSERFRRLSLNEAYVGDYVVCLDKHGLAAKEFTQVTAQSISNVQKALGKSKMRIAIPLIGIRQGTSGGVQGEIEQEILEAENVKPHDFYVSAMPKVSAAGGVRPVLEPIINLTVDGLSKDPMNPAKRKTRFNFTLHRGAYATIVLRELMKPPDPIKAGF